ncbi:MAG: hypothetical protein V3T42_00095 [Nitrospirales bacterium]
MNHSKVVQSHPNLADGMKHHEIGGNVQKSPSSKAAATLARGAYIGYVSTTKGRPAYAKPLRRRQGTPLADFFNIPLGDTTLQHKNKED